jgi:hypothetical protein
LSSRSRSCRSCCFRCCCCAAVTGRDSVSRSDAACEAAVYAGRMSVL